MFYNIYFEDKKNKKSFFSLFILFLVKKVLPLPQYNNKKDCT